MAAIKLDYFVKSLFIVHVYVVSFTGCLTKGKAVDFYVQGTSSPPTVSVYKESAKIQARDATNRRGSTTSVPWTTTPTKVLVFALLSSLGGEDDSYNCAVTESIFVSQRETVRPMFSVAYQCTIWKLF